MWRASRVCAPAWIAALVLVAHPSRADPPDPALALLAGASVLLAGFVVGGVLMGTSSGNQDQTSAGWMTIEAGFALAPFTSHAVAGEWARGLAFAAPPAATLAGTSVVIGVDRDAIDNGQLVARVSVWSLFTAGLLSGVAGVVDSTMAPSRARSRPVSVAPLVGSGTVGLSVGGLL